MVDNDIVNLKTNKKQKKPLLIYLLKCFAFEINNPLDYDISSDTISICKCIDGAYRLFFKDSVKRDKFMNSAIFFDGGYEILMELSCEDKIVERILLSRTYFSNDDDSYKIASQKLILVKD